MRGGAARRSMELLLETGVAQTLAPELVRMYQGPPSFEGLDAEPNARDEHAPRRALGWRTLDEVDALIERLIPSTPKSHRAPGESAEIPAPPTAAEITAELAALAAPLVQEPEPPPTDEPDLDADYAAAIEAEAAADADADAELDALPPGPGDDRELLDEPPSNALLFAALVAPFVRDVKTDRPGEMLTAIDDVLAPLVERLRVSRRDAERARQILLAQKRLAPSRRRRSRPMAVVRRDYFVEALTLYELVSRARGPLGDEVRRWRRLWRQDHAQAGPSGEHPAGAPPDGNVFPDATGRRKRRRRRGGRRRHRPGGMDGGPSGNGLVGGDEPR
jgi:poly(A) polymerase